MADQKFPAPIDGKNVCMDDLGEWLGERYQIHHVSGAHHKAAFYRDGHLWEARWCEGHNRLSLTLFDSYSFTSAKELYDFLNKDLALMDSFECETDLDLENGRWEIIVDFFWNPKEL